MGVSSRSTLFGRRAERAALIGAFPLASWKPLKFCLISNWCWLDSCMHLPLPVPACAPTTASAPAPATAAAPHWRTKTGAHSRESRAVSQPYFPRGARSSPLSATASPPLCCRPSDPSTVSVAERLESGYIPRAPQGPVPKRTAEHRPPAAGLPRARPAAAVQPLRSRRSPSCCRRTRRGSRAAR